MLKGADVSTWQRNIDYTKAKNDISFIIPRTGFAQTTDNTFRQNVANATAAGVAIPAVYHFSYALSTTDAEAEARYAVSECQITGLPKSTIIFFDLEYDSVNYAKKKGITLGKALCDQFSNAFCQQVIKMGYRTGIYLNLDYYKNMYMPTTLNNPDYFIWLADWTGGPDKPCAIQQYTSKGTVSGINGNVDMNYIYDERVMKETVSEGGKTAYEVAQEVIAGKWGFGADRKINLTNAGYDYTEVQNMVNNILTENADTPDLHPNGDGAGLPVETDASKTGWYRCKQDGYLRKAPGDNKLVACIVAKDVALYCSGLYAKKDDEVWLFMSGVPFNNGRVYEGYMALSELEKVQ